MAQICGKGLNFVRNDLDLLEITQICDKMAFMCWKWLKFVGNMLRNMINGFCVLEMA